MRALIVDDEPQARARFSRLLAKFPGVSVIGEAESGKEALKFIAENKIDVVFLDIDMPELNGLEVASFIGGAGPAIVFVTAYDEYALKAFEAHAIDYLLKPVSKDRLATTIDRLLARQVTRNPKIASDGLEQAIGAVSKNVARKRFVGKSGTRILIFDVSRVSAILAMENYSEVVYGESRVLIDESLDLLESRLDDSLFARIHRSSIINLEFLVELRRDGDRKYTAVLSDHFQSELPVARERLESFKERLTKP